MRGFDSCYPWRITNKKTIINKRNKPFLLKTTKKPYKVYDKKVNKKFKSISTKSPYVNFSIKKKKNFFWSSRYKWKYSFVNSLFWFSFLKKKNFSLVSKKKISSFFYFYYNDTHFSNKNFALSNFFYTFLLFFVNSALIKRSGLEIADYSYLIYKNTPLENKAIFSLFLLIYSIVNEKNFFTTLNKLKILKKSNLKKNKNFLISPAFLPKKMSTPIKNFKNKKTWVIRKKSIFFLQTKRSITNYYNFIRLFYKKKNYGFFVLNDRTFETDSIPYITRATPDFNKFFVLRIFPNFRTKKKCFFLNDSLYNNYNEKLSWYTKYSISRPKSRPTILFKFYKSSRNVSKLKKRPLSLYLNDATLTPQTLIKKKKLPIKPLNSVFKKIKIFINNAMPLFANIEFFFTASFFYLIGKNLVFDKFSLFKNNFLITLLSLLNFNFTNFFFYSKKFTNQVTTNVLPVNAPFSLIFKKYMVKTFNNKSVSSLENPFHYDMLTRFLEFCSGKKIYTTFNPFMPNMLNFEEKLQCLLWSQKIKSFRKVLGHRLFLNESLQIIYFCLKNKDVFVLSSWMLQMFYKISFWKYKLFFRYLQYVLRYFFWGIFDVLKTTGLKFQMKGKISVAGNARTRTVLTKIGTAGHATFRNRILHDLKLIRTFTGVIGFKTWIFF